MDDQRLVDNVGEGLYVYEDSDCSEQYGYSECELVRMQSARQYSDWGATPKRLVNRELLNLRLLCMNLWVLLHPRYFVTCMWGHLSSTMLPNINVCSKVSCQGLYLLHP